MTYFSNYFLICLLKKSTSRLILFQCYDDFYNDLRLIMFWYVHDRSLLIVEVLFSKLKKCSRLCTRVIDVLQSRWRIQWTEQLLFAKKEKHVHFLIISILITKYCIFKLLCISIWYFGILDASTSFEVVKCMVKILNPFSEIVG